MSEFILNAAPAADIQKTSRKPTALRGWLEVLSIPLLIPVGLIAGGLTGIAPMSAIMGVGLPLIAATLYLRHEGIAWRKLVFGRPLSLKMVAAYTLAALGGTMAAVYLTTLFLQEVIGLPKIDASAFALLEGNLIAYLIFLIPVAWGSAAIGEELLVRGYLMHRLEQLGGTSVAVVMQALIFSTAHFYQGVTGVITIFILSLVFAAVYLRNGRNLVPLILAHGLIDTFALTAFYFGRADLIVGT